MKQTPAPLLSSSGSPAGTPAAVPAAQLPAGARRWPWQTILLILLASALFLAWAIFVRNINDHDPIRWAGLFAVTFDPYSMGLSAQEILLPVALIFIFSRFQFVTRLIGAGDDPATRTADKRKLLFLMLAAQLLYGIYLFGLISSNENSINLGLFLVIAAGLLGGLPVGLAVGVLAAITTGVVEFVSWAWNDVVEFDLLIQYGILFNSGAVAAVWAGAVCGLLGDSLPAARRFAPWTLVAIAAGIEGYVAFCTFVGSNSESYPIDAFLPNLAVSLMAVLALSLMVRDVQSNETRRQAEATLLDLAQTNLALTQTKLALAHAELRALHAQINPHFFFNSLNTIRYFVRTDPGVARDLLTKLSELFQRTLSAGEFITLREEIAHVESYLALEKARLDERLQIIWTILVREELDQLIPTLILQPIVENAVIHGISPKLDGGAVHIVVTRVGDDLLLQVDDTGVGFERRVTNDGEDGGRRASIGLRNVDERLRRLYGDGYRPVIDSALGRGTRVVLRIPLAEGSSSPASVRPTASLHLAGMLQDTSSTPPAPPAGQLESHALRPDGRG
jgi:signal transduction histidine kinase